jgi:hypothetical protein
MTKMGEIATSRAIYIVGKVYKDMATHTVPQLEPCSRLHPYHCLTEAAEGIAKGARTIYGGAKKRAKMVYNDPLGSAINPIKIIDESIPSPMSYVDYLIKNPDEIVKTLKNPVAGVVGMPVAMAISDGRNAALENGVHPIPEEIKAKLSMYFDKRLLNSVRYAVGGSLFNGVTQGIALNTGAGAITLVNVVSIPIP